MTRSEYDAIKALSNSGMMHLKKSPAHYKAWLDSPQESTPALKLGIAVHCAILEPDKFDALYTPYTERRTKDGKAHYEALIAAGKEPVEADALDRIYMMRDAALRHPLLRDVLNANPVVETPITWVDGDSFTLCKGIPDIVLDGVVYDIKTTLDARPEIFQRSIYQYSYNRQGAFYLDGTGNCNEFKIFAIEKTPPYGVIAFAPDKEMIEAGRREYKQLVQLYERCIESGVWPGYTTDVITASMPRYAKDFELSSSEENNEF